MKLLNGKTVSLYLQKILTEEINVFSIKYKKTPHLVAILVGQNTASQVYVKNKLKTCEAVGMRSSLIQLGEDIQESILLEHVQQLNNDDDVDGFIIQLPLPESINIEKITQAIDPFKDVDGFHPFNLGQLLLNNPIYLPATPAGIIKLLAYYDISTEGKHCVIVGRSHIVGMPMSVILTNKNKQGNSTVTVVHSKTLNIAEHTQKADILIVAIGKPNFITADMVKEGVVIIDVGINRLADKGYKKGYRLVGDVNFKDVAPKSSYITPVPGGVGPMTVISLISNTLKAAIRRAKKFS